MTTTELTGQNFEDTITSNEIVLVDWWAAWCGPCRAFAPIFEQASATHADIVFGKIDTEAEPELAEMAQINSIPTLMAFRDGILLFNQAGALPAPGLEQLIKQVRELDMDQVRQQLAQDEAAGGEAPADQQG